MHFLKLEIFLLSQLAPALSVHDSFICHHRYAETGEMEKIMRRAFFEETGEQISKLDKERL